MIEDKCRSDFIECFEEGYKAAKEGYWFTDNPYCLETEKQKFDAWGEGWAYEIERDVSNMG